MDEKKLAKNTFFYTFALAAQKVLAFFYFIILARGIGVENTGRFTLALSFSTIFSMVLDFGLTQILIRETARNKEHGDKYLGNIIGLKILASVVVYLSVIIIASLMNYPEVTRNLIYVTGLVMVVDSYSLTIYGTIRGRQNLFYESIGAILNQTIVLLLGALLIFIKADLVLIMSAYLWASIANFAWGVYKLKKRYGVSISLKLDFKIIKYLLILSLPFALAGIFTRIFSSIDIILLSKLKTDYDVGIYSVAFRVAFALQFVALAFSASIYPAFSYYFAHQKEKLADLFTKSIYWLAFLSLPLSFGVIAVSDEVLFLVFGEEYLLSVAPLNVLMLSLFFIFLSFPVGAMLNACGRQSRNTFNLLIVSVFSIIGNLIVIPKFGYIGTAWINFFSYLLMFLLGLIPIGSIISYKKLPFIWAFIKIFIACLIMYFPVVIIKKEVDFIVAIGSGVIIYFTAAYVFKLFRIKDIISLLNEFRPVKATAVINDTNK
jgi:O-antigen/teichoic acid export membrane protein